MEKRSSFLIPEIYEATVDINHWDYVLQMLAKVTKSKAACLFYKDKEIDVASTVAQSGCSADMIKDYENFFVKLDPLSNANGDDEDITDITLTRVCQQYYPGSSNFDSVHKDFYENWMKPHGFYYLGGTQFQDNTKQTAAVALLRDKQSGAWSLADLRVISEIVPHLKRALNIHSEFIRLRIQYDALQKGLDRLVIGLILFDSSAHPVYVNPTAKAIIKGHPGLSLKDDGLFLNPPVKDINLKQTILDVAKIDPEDSWKQTRAIGVTHPDVETPLPVLVTPMHAHQLTSGMDYEGAKVAVFLSDSNQKQPISTENLVSVYHLSQSEAQVAIGIANGQCIDEIAVSTCRSTHTIRSQLKATFAKVGVTRQSDLIKLLLTGPFAHRRRSSSVSDDNKLYSE